MKRFMPSYQPKGGMCLTCRHALSDCSRLDFRSMPVLHAGASVVIVRCTYFRRWDNPGRHLS